MSKRIQIGHNHVIQMFTNYGGNPDKITGLIMWHPANSEDTRCAEMHDGWCGGAVFFDMPENAQFDRPKWGVFSLDPLTLTPSLLCHCGDHGFIQNGEWVVA